MLTSRLRQAARSYGQLDRRIWTLAVVRGVNTMGLSLVLAFMGIYLVTERGVSGFLYGGIYFVANVCQAAVNTYAGQLSDRIGRRQLIAAALGARAVVIAALGALVLVHAPVAILAVVIVVSSMLRGVYEPIASAIVADVAPPSQRVAAFGLQRVGVNVGWAVGPALGGFLASIIDYGYVFFCSTVPLMISAVVIARLEEPARPHPTAPAAVKRERERTRISLRAALAEAASRSELLLLLACALVFSVVQIQLFSTLSLYGKSELGLSNTDIGFLYTINGIGVVLLQVPAVAVIGRLTADRTLVIGSLIYAGALFSVGFIERSGLLGFAVVASTLGEVVLAPAQEASIAALADPNRLGRAFGLFGTMQQLGVAFAPLVGGSIYETLRQRPVAMWSVLAGIAGVLAVGYARFGALRRRRVPLDG